MCVCVCVLGSLGFPGQKGEKGHTGAAGPKGLRVSFQHIIEQKDLKKSIYTLIFTCVYILNKFGFSIKFNLFDSLTLRDSHSSFDS